MEFGHWSDCAIYNAPAYESGPCDCGGLDLTAYARYVAITSLVPTPGSLACFIKDGVLPSSVEAEQPPTLGVPAATPAPHLEGPHDRVPILGCANSMDFDNAGVATVRNPEPSFGLQRFTSDMPPHVVPSESSSTEGNTSEGGDNA